MTSDYSSESIRELYLRNYDTLYRVSFMYLKNAHDSEDAVHNTFLRLSKQENDLKARSTKKHGLSVWLQTYVKIC